MAKTVTITVKKKTLESVYNQVRLCNDMGFPNFQKGEPINDLMREAKRDINKQIKAKKTFWREWWDFWPLSIVTPLMLLAASAIFKDFFFLSSSFFCLAI